MTAGRRLASVPEPDLDRLAREVRAEVEQAERAHESFVEHAERVGRLLLEARPLCPYGTWHRWLREIDLPPSTATYYMRFAERIASPSDLPPTISETLAAHTPRSNPATDSLERLHENARKLIEVIDARPGRTAGTQAVDDAYKLALQNNPAWAWSRAVAALEQARASGIRAPRGDFAAACEMQDVVEDVPTYLRYIADEIERLNSDSPAPRTE